LGIPDNAGCSWLLAQMTLKQAAPTGLAFVLCGSANS